MTRDPAEMALQTSLASRMGAESVGAVTLVRRPGLRAEGNTGTSQAGP